MASPFPVLRVYPQSHLTFPWAELNPYVEGTSDAHFGPEGAGVAMIMLIYWRDLETAVQQLVGHSWRDKSSLTPDGRYWLRRVLPWQHPYWNHMWVKAITSVKGIRMQGTNFSNPGDNFQIGIGGGVGQGQPQVMGPWSEYQLAKLTIQFWRPPYAIRSDTDVLDAAGNPQEWLRYTDKHWSSSTQMLSREAGQFQWASATGALVNHKFHGTVGQKLSRQRVSRTWYQIPEAAIFEQLVDSTPNGIPFNLLYSRTSVTNPITGLVYPIGSNMTGSLNVPKGGGKTTVSGTITSGNKTITGLANDPRVFLGITGGVPTGIAIGCFIDGKPATGIPVGTCVASVDNATTVTMTQAATATDTADIIFISDATAASRFFGCFMGTLLYENFTLDVQPLQLPAYLMDLPQFANNESISQVQYDVTFHFELFDPDTGYGEYHRGHNLYPYSGNGLWYPARSALDDSSPPAANGPFATPFAYADFSDLFKIY